MKASRFPLAICTIFIVMVLAACGQEAAPETLTASLSELEGTVVLKPAGGDEFVAAAEGVRLEQNGQVQTGDDGRVRLDLSSGTLIRMAPSSLFTLVSNEATEGGLVTRLRLELGEIFVILNGGSLDVETPSGVASVRGSYMGVWVDPETLDVYVTCLEGDCNAENEAGEADFSDGEKTILFRRNADGTYTPPEVEEMTEEDFQNWLDSNPEARELFEQAVATLTAMAPTEETEAPADEPTATPEGGSGGGAGSACLQILHPPAGSALPNEGPVEFEWEGLDQAASYIVTFHYPGGGSDSFSTDEPGLRRYIESITSGGEFTWDVTAVDADGEYICTTDPVSFTKPESKPAPQEKEKEEEQEGPPACSAENNQWDDPEAPCYCDPYAEEPPAYCALD
jgi:ferric-dicitrate binding protein FerR (iron transport regulator)